MTGDPSTQETNVPGRPGAPDSQGASGSGGSAERPAPPPLLPELEQPPPAATSSPQATHGTDGSKVADWLAFLRNRLILGGLAIIVVLLLIAIVLLVVGSGDGGPRRRLAAGAGTPNSDSTVVPRGGLIGHVRTTVAMRNGPGSTYSILGTIPRGALMSVVGRNADESWLQVTYPPGSQLRGWVDAAFIEVTGDISQLAIAKPSAGPSVPVPTGAVPIVDQRVAPSPTQPPPAPTATQPPTTATPHPRPTATPHPRPTSTRPGRPTVTRPAPPTATPPAAPTMTPTLPATPQPTATSPPPPTETPTI